ncbi:MAG: hypothetical protein AB8B80_14080 [Marinicellaceae bacterium]
MIKNNLFGQMLIGIIVILLLISSIQMFGWGVGVGSVSIDEENLSSLPKVPRNIVSDETIVNVDNKTLLEEIANRPMFSATREPFQETEIPDVDVDVDKPVINALKAQLTGVVITPEQSYAMILDTTTNQRETYKVGMPLEGEQGGWTLNSIQSRKVTFVSDDNEKAELELEVYSKKLKVGKQSGKNRSSQSNAGEDDKKSDNSREEKKKNADDIRKKIAERRAQMRAEAAKKNK